MHAETKENIAFLKWGFDVHGTRNEEYYANQEAIGNCDEIICGTVSRLVRW